VAVLFKVWPRKLSFSVFEASPSEETGSNLAQTGSIQTCSLHTSVILVLPQNIRETTFCQLTDVSALPETYLKTAGYSDVEDEDVQGLITAFERAAGFRFSCALSVLVCSGERRRPSFSGVSLNPSSASRASAGGRSRPTVVPLGVR
jgi:hypothetical protein